MAIVFLAVLISSIAPLAALAQQSTATLSGRIVDPNGAVIPGAKVKAKQTATGLERETQTNDEGFFTLTNLVPSDYEVTIEANGFKTKYALATLQVGQVVSLDMMLEIGLAATADDFSGSE